MDSQSNIIAGAPRTSRRLYAVQNPATLEIVGEAPLSDSADIDAAVQSALAAFPGWAADRAMRQVALRHCADIIETHIDDLGRLLSLEHGKPFPNAVAEFRNAANILQHYAAWTESEQMLRDRPDQKIRVVRTPIGAVGLIVPWNAPINILHMKLAPALWAGNTVVIKPAPTTPLSTLRYLALIAEVLPAGVVNSVTGGAQIGAALVAHPGLTKISFTGSTATGRHIMRGAADMLKRLTLELGGNDAAIVLDDVDPAVVAPKLFMSAFANAGQICVAIKRLYVHETVAEEITARIAAIAEATVVGSGLEKGVQMGPLNNRAQLDFVEGLLDDAKQHGGHVVAGGKGLDTLPGHFLRPTIVTGLNDEARLVREEQFGPALPVLSFSDAEDALVRANATEMGLGGSVWSGDPDRAAALAARLEAGNLYVNHHAVPPDPEIPFGGVKQSGFGYELGAWGVDDFSNRKVLSVAR